MLLSSWQADVHSDAVPGDPHKRLNGPGGETGLQAHRGAGAADPLATDPLGYHEFVYTVATIPTR